MRARLGLGMAGIAGLAAATLLPAAGAPAQASLTAGPAGGLVSDSVGAGSPVTDPLGSGVLDQGPLPAGPPSGDAVITGYGGSNPFDCRIQHAGRTVDFRRPQADPFCVEYDKTHQNIDQLGVVEFLSKEPARVAAASDKCFYYQRDHWHASVVQGAEQTEIYDFDGSYYFDKARGAFGVYVENFSVANSSVDSSVLPGFSERFEPYFGYGRGGFQVVGEVPVVPRCVEKAQEQDPYKRPAGGV